MKALADRSFDVINLLHITAHLGGGVGKVLARLAAESRRRQDGIRHTVACLETIEKTQFVEQFQAQGGQLLLCRPADSSGRYCPARMVASSRGGRMDVQRGIAPDAPDCVESCVRIACA